MNLEISILCLSILTIYCLKKFLSKDPKPIFNIYRLPGKFYCLKVLFMYIILSLRKLKRKKINYEEVDKAQPLSKSDKPIDAVYFNCSNSKNECLITGVARRKANQVDGFMFLKMKELGILKSNKLPDTTLYQTEQELNSFAAGGISLKPIEAPQNWEIKYNGKMLDQDNKEHEVCVEALWNSDKDIFNFESDIDPYLMATCIAHEKWSREYFDLLKKMHQTHYEQGGNLLVKATVDGKLYNLELNGMRDHSFGYKRDWNDLYRYVFHLVNTRNGGQLNIAIVSMPVSFSRLCFGYYYVDGQKKAVPLQECDFQLFQHGESGTPPKDYAFTFKAGGKSYTLEAEVIDQVEFYISKEWESKVYELISNYKLNGSKAWGVSEWQYKNIRGRSVKS